MRASDAGQLPQSVRAAIGGFVAAQLVWLMRVVRAGPRARESRSRPPARICSGRRRARPLWRGRCATRPWCGGPSRMRWPVWRG